MGTSLIFLRVLTKIDASAENVYDPLDYHNGGAILHVYMLILHIYMLDVAERFNMAAADSSGAIWIS